MIRVLVVDDYDFFRSCLVDLINGSHDLVAVGECADGSEVAAAVQELRPDVVLMDVRMGRMSGLDAAALLQHDHTCTRVVMLTSDTTPSSQATARRLGASGYLIKGLDGDLVLEAVRRVAQGATVWPADREAASPPRP